MRKVVVTGANGFIGSSLIKKLIENQVSVVALDVSFVNSNMPQSDLINKVEIRLDDIDEVLMNVPSDEYDAFYHFAWQGVNGSDKADPCVQVNNIRMALNCANVAKALNCKKFLCAGTIAERATESLRDLSKTSGGMMYGAAKHSTHLMIETYCKNIDQNFVWLQFSNIYGPKNKTGNLISYTIEQLIKGQEATFGPALQPYDFIFVDDLIEAILRIGNKETSRNMYFIGSGEPRILKDYLTEIGEIYGRPDLIKTGVRPDDGIKYSVDMFDTTFLVSDIGDFVSMDFNEAIRYTIANY